MPATTILRHPTLILRTLVHKLYIAWEERRTQNVQNKTVSFNAASSWTALHKGL